MIQNDGLRQILSDQYVLVAWHLATRCCSIAEFYGTGRTIAVPEVTCSVSSEHGLKNNSRLESPNHLSQLIVVIVRSTHACAVNLHLPWHQSTGNTLFKCETALERYNFFILLHWNHMSIDSKLHSWLPGALAESELMDFIGGLVKSREEGMVR